PFLHHRGPVVPAPGPRPNSRTERPRTPHPTTSAVGPQGRFPGAPTAAAWWGAADMGSAPSHAARNASPRNASPEPGEPHFGGVAIIRQPGSSEVESFTADKN